MSKSFDLTTNNDLTHNNDQHASVRSWLCFNDAGLVMLECGR